jgi:hypothetical protein
MPEIVVVPENVVGYGVTKNAFLLTGASYPLSIGHVSDARTPAQ